MKIYSNNIKDTWLDKEFGGNADNKAILVNGNSIKSFHIGWEELPKNTKDLCLIFDDYDAIPVCGFNWIHWIVFNINPEWKELKENASIELKDILIQGCNSTSSPFFHNGQWVDTTGYCGCAPPNCDHEYRVRLFALDTKLNLKNGFKLNELIKAMRNHVIDEAVMYFNYKKLNK